MRQYLYKDNDLLRERVLWGYDYLITRKLKEKYGDCNLGKSICISKKDNLVFTIRKAGVCLTNEEYKRGAQRFKNAINATKTAYEKRTLIKNSNPRHFVGPVPIESHDFKILTYKLIVTKDGRLYYVNGKKIYRLAIKTKEQISTLSGILCAMVSSFGYKTIDKAAIGQIKSYFENVFPIFKSVSTQNNFFLSY